jgi:hypothetical protein
VPSATPRSVCVGPVCPLLPSSPSALASEPDLRLDRRHARDRNPRPASTSPASAERSPSRPRPCKRGSERSGCTRGRRSTARATRARWGHGGAGYRTYPWDRAFPASARRLAPSVLA